MQPTDITRIVSVSGPTLSPDGRIIAVVVTRTDAEANHYRGAIWLAPTDGSHAARPLTHGPASDQGPAWSPDGTRLAFTRTIRGTTGAETVHRIQVLNVDGPGELLTLAEGNEAFGELEWSPDGDLLTGSVRVRDPRYDAPDERSQPARRIDNLRSRLDNEGWTVDRRRHVFVVPADGLAPLRFITSGPYEHGQPRWSPDGSRIVLAAARHEDWDIRLASDLFLADPRAVGGSADEPDLVQLTTTLYDLHHPTWSPDGTHIAVVLSDNRSMPRHAQIGVVDASSGDIAILTASLDRSCAPTSGDVPPVWSADGTWLYFTMDDHGDVPLYRVRADGSAAPEPVLTGRRWITDFDSDGDTIAFIATSATQPVELFAARPNGAGFDEEQLTNVQADFLAISPPLGAEQFTVPSPAGDVDLDVWLVRPSQFDATSRYPMLLLIHGGPMTQCGNRWFDEVELYASAGYVVVFTNPHGATGDSEAFMRAIRMPSAKDDPGTGWGGIDYDDLMAVVDAALEREPAIDPDRLGTLGGSYGGFMASWIVGHTDRFAAACSERAVNNMFSEEWTSDIAGLFRLETGIESIDNLESLMECSPISYARNIDTPLLILHSENDLRCPVEQADQLFSMLRVLGKPVEYWRFPAEGHELSRSGAPSHRVQRAEILLDFFGRHLKPA